jgi:hypothetical protein
MTAELTYDLKAIFTDVVAVMYVVVVVVVVVVVPHLVIAASPPISLTSTPRWGTGLLSRG